MAIPIPLNVPQNPDDARPEDYSPLPEGYYHVKVRDLDPSKMNGQSPYLIVKFECLAGTEVGRTVREKFFLSQAAIGRLTWLGRVCGLIKQGGQQNPDFELIKGKQLVVHVIHDKYKDQETGEVKTTAKLSYDGMYMLSDPKVAAVQRAAFDEGSSGSSGSSAPPAPPTTPRTPPRPPQAVARPATAPARNPALSPL